MGGIGAADGRWLYPDGHGPESRRSVLPVDPETDPVRIGHSTSLFTTRSPPAAATCVMDRRTCTRCWCMTSASSRRPSRPTFSQLFLGIQIQCAECHNHPFDRWTMDDYYGFVSFFTGITRKPGAEPREFYIFNNRQSGSIPSQGRWPSDGRHGSWRVKAPLRRNLDSRVALARWLTSPQNGLFARNIANRTVGALFPPGAG